VYRGGGLLAVGLLGAVLVMVIGGLYLWQCRALHAAPAVSVALFLLAAPLLMKWLAVRPQLVDFIALPLLMFALQRVVVGHRRPQTIIATGLLALFLSVRRRDVVLVGTLGVLLVAAASAIRFLPMVVLIGLPILAAGASAPHVLRYLRSRRVVLLPGAGIAMVALFVLAVPSLAHLGRVDPEVFPRSLVDQIPRNCQLFNAYSFGGYVILERPDVRVSMDSRNDLYGAEQVLAQGQLIAGKGDLTTGLRGAGCVLVAPHSGLARRLERDPGWRTVGREPTAALFVRRP
jgi:hypothetical protein